MHGTLHFMVLLLGALVLTACEEDGHDAAAPREAGGPPARPLIADGDRSDTTKPLNEPEQARLKQARGEWPMIQARYVPKAIRQGAVPEQLDATLIAWRKDAATDRPSEDQIIRVLASAFGDHLVATHGMVWIHASDAMGESAAVQHPQTKFKAYPYNTVGDRLGNGDDGFFVPLDAALKETISQPTDGQKS